MHVKCFYLKSYYGQVSGIIISSKNIQKAIPFLHQNDQQDIRTDLDGVNNKLEWQIRLRNNIFFPALNSTC